MVTLKTQRHHWWPIGVSRFWADANGCVNRLSSDGKVLSLQPDKFGLIKNAHHVKLGDESNIWDYSYEHTFGTADGAFPHLIAWMASRMPRKRPSTEGFEERVEPLKIPESDHHRMAECVASLIVRSPSMRHRLRTSVEDYRAALGIQGAISESLIGANAQNGQFALSNVMRHGGKFAILHSPDRELIFGDGFFSSVSHLSSPLHSVTCLVPITPELALYYTRPMSFNRYPRSFALSLSITEAELINYFTQIYAGNYVFYRNERPEVRQEFSEGRFLEIAYHEHDWLEGLSHAMCQVRYGPDSLYQVDGGEK